MSGMQTIVSATRDRGVRIEGDRSPALSVDAAAGIVHDLGNLIQIASSAVNIVARSPNIRTADLEPVIAGARASLERAGALVRQTIGMVRQSIAADEDVSVAGCLIEMQALVRATWDRAFRLDIDAGMDLPLVRCELLALQSAVLNLLLNARDAMPNGGVIAIRAAAAPLEFGLGVELSVTDSGVGMTPDTIARAFDPFFTTKCDGLGGVGLPMVERFANEAGGLVAIESEYGVGTTVRLQLPASSQSMGAAPRGRS